MHSVVPAETLMGSAQMLIWFFSIIATVAGCLWCTRV